MPYTSSVLWDCLWPHAISSFFFNCPASTEIYALSLHDALPIFEAVSWAGSWRVGRLFVPRAELLALLSRPTRDRKSTRLNSSHLGISYAVFCLKKKNQRDRQLLRSSPKRF